MDYLQELKAVFSGDIDTSDVTRETYSHDASLFELKPTAVLYPKSSADIQAVVATVAKYKKSHPGLSVTPRSAGTDMSGGAINDSLIMDMTKYMNKLGKMSATSATAQPGLHYRDFDKSTIDLNVMLPSYPASRDLCTVGGMASNNSGGEKSLQYGKTANFVTELKMVWADGKEYTVKPLTKPELVKKMVQKDFEGNVYKKVFELLEAHYDEIQAAKPHVNKDSTGYHIWEAWNRETGIFDLTKIIVGAQGTLGIITDVTFRLVPRPSHSGLLVGYLRNLDNLGEIIPKVLEHKPVAFEAFDDNTLFLSIKFFFIFIKKLGFVRWFKLALQLIPDGIMLVKGIPQMILMVEFTGSSVDEVKQKIDRAKGDLQQFNFSYLEDDETEFKSEKFWLMRRESFNLLRSKVKDKHTAPFIDDFVVPPARLSEFLPQLRDIIKRYKLISTIQGHLGDGNFHVIPLMKIEDPNERAKLQPAMKEVNTLVLKYGGSISGEHNDGLVRGPWLETMYGPAVFGYMKDVKHIFDEHNIFNPHKKTDAKWDYSFSHIRQHF